MWNAAAVAALTLSYVGVAQEAAAGNQQVTANIEIQVHVEGESYLAWVQAAQPLLKRIFAEALIGIEWVECGSGADPRCDRAAAANEFVVRVLKQRLDPASHGCGVSLRPDAAPGHHVTLFLDCIAAASDSLGTPEAVLVAYTLAHEIGHLLLPIGHAWSGIMRARPDRLDWRRAERGTLRFRPSEVQHMQAALRRRGS